MSAILLLLLALVFLVLAVVITAAESALSFIPRQEVEALYEDRSSRDSVRRLHAVLNEPSRHQTALSFWRVWCEMAAAVAVALLFYALLPNVWLAGLFATVVMAGVGFVFVGVSPREFGRQRSLTVTRRTAWLIQFLGRILGPIPRWLAGLGGTVGTGSIKEGFASVSEEELREFIDRASESEMIEDDEAELIQSVFDLDDTLVRSVMVPRPDVVSIADGETLKQAMKLFIRSGYSRVPVFGDSADDVLGVLYLKDVVAAQEDPAVADTRLTVTDLSRPVRYVPESKPVAALLRELQSESTHVSIVIDEYGGTAGLVTLEDLIEEIVGEIVDEYDAATEQVEDLGEGRYWISARMSVDDLAELFGKTIDDDEVDTAGGLLAKELGRVPIVGAQATVKGIALTAERSGGRRNQITHLVAQEIPEPADDDSWRGYSERRGERHHHEADNARAHPSAKAQATQTPATQTQATKTQATKTQAGEHG